MDLDILDELSNLQWDRQLEPKEGEERFEFQLNLSGRNRLRKMMFPEKLLLKHAKYILNNVENLQTDLTNTVRRFDDESFVYRAKDDLDNSNLSATQRKRS